MSQQFAPAGSIGGASAGQSSDQRRKFATILTAAWREPATRTAVWLMSIGILAALAATLVVNYSYNAWNRLFFDAVGAKSVEAMFAALTWLPAIVLAGAALAATMTWLKLRLQLKWRGALTRSLAELWLSDQRYYRVQLAHAKSQNIEHRLAEDVKLATDAIVELGTGFLWSLANATMFFGILIFVGGSIVVGSVTVPGYMAVAAVVYAALVSGIAALIGRRLPAAIAATSEQEAQFRYELMRVRENAESIAFLRGDENERDRATKNFDAVAALQRVVIGLQRNLTAVVNANLFLAPAVPAILAAPKYMTGELSLGALIQLATAFAAVLGALNWMTDNFVRLSELRAAIDRLATLTNILDALEDIERQTEAPHGGDIEIRNVVMRKADGTVLVSDANALVLSGDRVLIEGRSGSGKSTLLRLLAGFWPWADGDLRMPHGSRVAFVPQRPYLPAGTLADAIAYPARQSIDADTGQRLLTSVGLPHLAPRLNEVDAWDQVLSGGERQRVAIARVIHHAPDLVVLDEATSALDDRGQDEVFSALISALPNATLLNVAHREGLAKFHDRKMVIEASSDGPIVATRPLSGKTLEDLVAQLKR